MLASPPVFKNSKEFSVVSLVILFFIAVRLLFLYMEYSDLKNLKEYYYSDAQVERVYDSKNYKNGSSLLKLKSSNGKSFYLFTQKEPPKRFSWVRVKYKLKSGTGFLKYLSGFFAKGDIVEPIEDGFDPRAFLRKQIDAQHDGKSAINTFYHAIFLADPLDRELREKISNLGVSHLVAISGFHLGIMWLFLFGILFVPYRYFQQNYFPWRNRNIDLGLVTLLILGVFVLFVGAPPALTRSYVMLSLAWLVLVFGLELISFQFLAFAILVILLFKPTLIASLGFWLSVSGVFYIFLIIKWLQEYPGWFITIVAIPVGVFLLMFPVGHLFFHNTTGWQLMSPPLSLLFIPFYPIALFMHLLGLGDIFDPGLLALFELPQKSSDITMPHFLIILYALSSITAIFSRRIFYFLLLFAALIVGYYIFLSSFANG
ncbi:MAG TPA: ComEC/Rec2 family competence protein [Nitratifractor sp.]|nr:ComEC/Rec2 family competence protein [Nitratifractor sp.]HHD74942.1 ComEC/Rec2 family competence protein [Nitratifractor sp.]